MPCTTNHKPHIVRCSLHSIVCMPLSFGVTSWAYLHLVSKQPQSPSNDSHPTSILNACMHINPLKGGNALPDITCVSVWSKAALCERSPVPGTALVKIALLLLPPTTLAVCKPNATWQRGKEPRAGRATLANARISCDRQGLTAVVPESTSKRLRLLGTTLANAKTIHIQGLGMQAKQCLLCGCHVAYMQP